MNVIEMTLKNGATIRVELTEEQARTFSKMQAEGRDIREIAIAIFPTFEAPVH